MTHMLPKIANFHQPAPGLYCSGQPAAGDWAALRAAGVRSVINLRTTAEQPGPPEQEGVEAAGLAYAHVAVADGAALGRSLVVRVHEAMRDMPAPWLVHCASANRVGAVLALRAAWHQGEDAKSALALGRRAGLAGLEPTVRQLLGAASD